MSIKKSLTVLFAGASALVSTMSYAADEVNVYSYRQAFLIEPMMKEFTAETGVKVNILFADKGLIERIKREGKLSTADLMLGVAP